ncbi:WD40 repeat-like protein [Coprinellus micaceus]|uniref:WD40 repeat-like protein n=1 Tax=Coprinellus micaceus TaxID=71717 RepID=A0A4Y7RZ99_COPMI|nr:WD40 repeat-like protein [Coprinellus micaceus]
MGGEGAKGSHQPRQYQSHSRAIFGGLSRGRRTGQCDCGAPPQVAGQSVLQGHTETVYSVAFSPDGAQVVSGSADNIARLWDAKLGKQLMLLEGHTNEVNSRSVLERRCLDRVWCGRRNCSDVGHSSGEGGEGVKGPHEPCLVSCNLRRWQAGSLCLWGSHCALVGCRDGQGDESAAWPHSRRHECHILERWKAVISGSLDGTIRVWDTMAGEVEQQMRQGVTGDIYSVAFSDSGTQIVSGSDDNSVRVWDGMTGEQLGMLKGHTGAVNSVAFSTDGTRIGSGSDDKSVRVWCTETGKELLLLQGHTGVVYSVAFSNDGARIVSASWDRTVRVWDAVKGGGRES